MSSMLIGYIFGWFSLCVLELEAVNEPRARFCSDGIFWFIDSIVSAIEFAFRARARVCVHERVSISGEIDQR